MEHVFGRHKVEVNSSSGRHCLTQQTIVRIKILKHVNIERVKWLGRCERHLRKKTCKRLHWFTSRWQHNKIYSSIRGCGDMTLFLFHWFWVILDQRDKDNALVQFCALLARKPFVPLKGGWGALVCCQLVRISQENTNVNDTVSTYWELIQCFACTIRTRSHIKGVGALGAHSAILQPTAGRINLKLFYLFLKCWLHWRVR